ncbi:MAG TPA: trigger factor, partial [Candidatus Fimousia stercorigallinarum]|nr:trigger factor [Candidatus Fimousia stercorigallinarum]
REQMLEEMKPQAKKRIQSRLVLEAIVAAENIQATEEDVEKEFANMAEMYQMEADKIKEIFGDAQKEQMKEDIAVQKAVDFLVAESK